MKKYHVVKQDEVLTFDYRGIQMFQHERKLFIFTNDEHCYEFNKAHVRYLNKTTVMVNNSDKRIFRTLLWSSDLTVLLNEILIVKPYECAKDKAYPKFIAALIASNIDIDQDSSIEYAPNGIAYFNTHGVNVANGNIVEVM